MMWRETFWSGGMWIFPIVGLTVFLVMVYVFLTRIAGAGGSWCGRDSRDTGSPRDPSPLDILKIRYAKGEIDREEFERMKRDIGDDGDGKGR